MTPKQEQDFLYMMTSDNVVILKTQLELTGYEEFKARIRGLRAEWTTPTIENQDVKMDTTIHCSDTMDDARAELKILEQAINRAHLFNDEEDTITSEKDYDSDFSVLFLNTRTRLCH